MDVYLLQNRNTKERIQLASVKPHFRPAVRAGDFIFVSGQMPFDDNFNVVGNEIVAQTKQCLKNVASALALEGANLGHVVKVMVWLTDTEDFPAFNETYATAFPDAPPARATVCSALMVPGARVEIEATAFYPASAAKEQ